MNKKQIYSWALYDWANSAFATTVMAGFFPIFFSQYWSNPDNLSVSTFYLGLGNSVASLIVALLAPILGAIADRGSFKKKFLIFFAFLGIVMTLGLGFIAQGMWQIALMVYIFSTIGFSGANIFYDSLLPSVSNEENVDDVSALGFSLGYLGGGVLIIINFLMISYPASFGLVDAVEATKYAFISVGVWWALFSLPLILFVDEPKYHESESVSDSIINGLIQFRNTFNDLKKLKVVATFLLAYWLYIDGVDTIIRMAVDYGTSIGFSASSLITALLLVQFIAFPATLGFNWYSSKIGIKKAIYTAIIGYSTITIFASLVKEEWHFYVLAVMIACFQGGIQSLSRSMYARIIPVEKAAQFYGFYNMLGKFAAIIGPPLMGYVGLVTGNPRIGILSIVILFISGGFILTKVDLDEGEKIAKSYLSK